MVETIRGDVANLEELNDQFALMQTLHEANGTLVDVRELAQTVGTSSGCGWRLDRIQ